MLSTAAIITNACNAGIVVPAFNVPYLPMVKPVVKAVVDLDSFALVEVARIEWLKFECRGPAAVDTGMAGPNRFDIFVIVPLPVWQKPDDAPPRTIGTPRKG